MDEFLLLFIMIKTEQVDTKINFLIIFFFSSIFIKLTNDL